MILLAVLFFSVAPDSLLRAQSIQIEGEVDSMSHTIAHLFGALDTNYITTKVLIDKSLDLIDMADFKFSGGAGDTADINTFGLIYARLSDSWHSAGPYYLPEPEDAYLNESLNLMHSDTVPLVVLADRFDQFKPDALSLDLIDFYGNQFHDVISRSASPYITDSVFIATPLTNVSYKQTITFILRPEQVFSRLDTLLYLEVDFDDGNSIRTIYPGDTVTVAWSSLGQKIISSRGIFASTPPSGWVQSLIDLLAGLGGGGGSEGPQPDMVVSLDADETQSGYVLEFFLRCPEEGVNKPLIIVNGYDPPQKEKLGIMRTAGIMFVFLSQKPFPSTLPDETMLDFVGENGFDLVWLTYKDGGAPLINLSRGVKEAIKKVNELKELNGSREQNVIVGVSHGGVAGKFALLDMEAEHEDHETDIFINFDEGNRGANFSLAAQHMLKHLLNIKPGRKPLKSYIPLGTEIEEIFKARALADLIEYSAWSQDEISSPTKVDFFEDLAVMGLDEDSRLKNCTYLTISNGSLNGIRQQHSNGIEKDPGSSLLSLDAPIPTVIGRLHLDLQLNYLPDHPSTPTEVYNGRYAIKILFGTVTVWSDRKVIRVTDTDPLDTAPGGYMGFDGGDQGDFLQSISTVFNSSLPLPIGPFCITPAVSSIDLRDPEYDNLYYNMTDVEEIVEEGITRTHSYIGVFDDSHKEEHNHSHPSLTPVNMPFFLSFVQTDPLLATAEFSGSGRQYNLGKSHTPFNIASLTLQTRRSGHLITRNLTLSNANELWFNHEGKIGFQDITTNGTNIVNPRRSFYITKDPCEDTPPTVIIANSSKMVVGDTDDETHHANVTCEKGALLRIGDDGEVVVNAESHLIFADFGKGEIQSGGMLELKWGARGFIKNNGELRVEEGGILRVSQYSSLKVESGGRLILEPGALVQLWDGNDPNGTAVIQVEGQLVVEGDFDFSGNGYFEFLPGHSLTLHETEWVFTGSGTEHRNIVINSIPLAVPTNKRILLEEMTVSCKDDGFLSVPSGTTFRTKDVNFHQDNSYVAISANYPRRLDIQSSTFHDFENAIFINGYDFTIPHYLRIEDCLFTECLTAISAIDCRYFYLIGSEITDGRNYATGLDLLRVKEASIESCVIEEQEDGVSVRNSKYVRFSDTEIRYNDNGVNGSIQNTSSNLFFYKGSRIANNDNGVLLEGEHKIVNGNLVSNGLVLMDCAQLVYNHIGIQGTDILLAIDAPTHAKARGTGTLQPNTFLPAITSGSLLFDIELDDRDIPVVYARGNYWGGAGPTGGTYSIVKGVTQIPLESSSYVTKMPTTCSDPGGPIVLPSNEDIMDEFSTPGGWTPSLTYACANQDTALGSFFWNGFYEYGYLSFLSDSTSYAEQYMQQFAVATPGDTSSIGWVTDYCGHLQDVAKIFLEGGLFLRPQNLGIADNLHKLVDAEGIHSGLIRAYPNPGTEFVYLFTGTLETVEVSVKDIHGRVVKYENFSNISNHTISLDTREWVDGLYIIEVNSAQAPADRTYIKWIKRK